MSSVVPSSPSRDALIAVLGNPNTGKSTLFNALTGSDQKVGNYPGVTVERKSGRLSLESGTVTLLDLPGTYSLTAVSRDEQVVHDALSGRLEGVARPDAVLCIADATNLERNLFLASQVSELGLPMCIALNLSDEAAERGIVVDVPLLSKRLGVPVVPTVATTGKGIAELKSALQRLLSERPTPVACVPLQTVRDAAGADAPTADAEVRYRHIRKLLEGVVTASGGSKRSRGYQADLWLTHRFWGLIIFFGLMFLMFSSIYWVAQPFMEVIKFAFERLGVWTGQALEGSPILASLVRDGIIGGIKSVLVFLPQILILFLFIGILEDSGYMARAAFLMDKAFRWTGLNGKSFVPMLSAYACAIPAVMSTRTIEDPKARLGTILITPLMSCSARLPVYVLLIGLFIEPRYGTWWAGATLFAMHLVGLIVAIPMAFLFNRFLLRFRSLPFLLELPPYRTPRSRQVFRRMYVSGRDFVVRAGTVIVGFSVIIWALSYFPRSEGEARLDQSYLGRAGRAVQPVFAPAGFDWKITVGVLASFPAREVILSTLGILYAEPAEESTEKLERKLESDRWPDGRPIYTPAVALAVMVFFALCMQCGSTVAIIAREAGWKWALFSFSYMTLLAWVGAVTVYQVGSRIL